MADALDQLLAQQATAPASGAPHADALDGLLSAQAQGTASPAPAQAPAAQGRPPLPGLFSKAGMEQLGTNAENLFGGALHRAASFGSSILGNATDAASAVPDKWRPQVAQVAQPTRDQRMASVDAALTGAGVDPTSLQFKSGDMMTSLAGTVGAGAVIAAPFKAAAAALPVLGRVLAPLAASVESGGFSLGSKLPAWASIPTRAVGGAVNGAATAAYNDPKDAKTGAMIGAAMPLGAQVVGKSAQFVANALRSATTPQEVKVAQQLAQQLGVTAEDIQAAMTGPQMIPGYQPTVPQMVQNPVASQLQRTLQSSGQQAIADAGKVQQGQFRDALGRIAPIANTINDAGNRAGSAIAGYALPAEAAARQNVSSLFNAVPDAEAQIQLPLQQMQAAQTRFVGPGTFGKGNGTVEQAMQAATHIGMDPLNPLTPRSVPFSQLQALRSSIGEAITGAQANGQNQAAAALTTMKNAIDNKVADVAAGNAQAGEVFTPQAIDTWGQALAAHQAKMGQFNTGPQASIFRMGADGQPAIQGAEIPGKFFNGNRSQVEDMQAFRRLVGNRDDLAREMKSYALTEGATTVGKSGDLAQNFIKWMNSRSGAIGGLFNDQERATIGEVGKAVQRQMLAEDLGRVSGPDTAQKLASLQSNGLLDNKMVDAFARKVPLLGHFTGPMLDGLRRSAAQSRGGIQAGLLADPQRFAEAIGRAPGLLNFDPAPLGLLTRGAYPALSSQ